MTSTAKPYSPFDYFLKPAQESTVTTKPKPKAKTKPKKPAARKPAPAKAEKTITDKFGLRDGSHYQKMMAALDAKEARDVPVKELAVAAYGARATKAQERRVVTMCRRMTLKVLPAMAAPKMKLTKGKDDNGATFKLSRA